MWVGIITWFQSTSPKLLTNYKGEIGNFMVEKLRGHCLNQMIKVKIINIRMNEILPHLGWYTKNSVTSMTSSQWCTPEYDHAGTSDKLILWDSVQNMKLVIFKSVKVMKVKGRRRNYSKQKKIDD